MKINRNEKIKTLLIFVIILITLLIFSSFIVFIKNIKTNVSSIPFIFLLISIYNIILFFYYLFYSHPEYHFSTTTMYVPKKYIVKPSLIFYFILSFILFVITFTTIWI